MNKIVELYEKAKSRFAGDRLSQVWKISLILLASSLALLVDYLYQGSFNESGVVVISIIAVFAIVVVLRPAIGKKFYATTGLDKADKTLGIRIFVVAFFMTFLVFYILLPDKEEIIPTALKFNIIMISAVLGGLVLTASGNRRINTKAHDELISIARKLIMATILFLLFVILFYWLEITETFNMSIIDLSYDDIFSTLLSYLAIISFYLGIFLFSFGLIDLSITLGHLKRRKQRY